MDITVLTCLKMVSTLCGPKPAIGRLKEMHHTGEIKKMLLMEGMIDFSHQYTDSKSDDFRSWQGVDIQDVFVAGKF